MPIVSHPATDEYRDNFEATFGKKKEKHVGVVAYPKDQPPRYNGGVLCDMLIGPCACGAWHSADETEGQK